MFWRFPSFNNTLRLIKLSKAHTHGTIYYSEEIHIKISKRKKHVGQGPAETKHSLSSCPLPVELWVVRRVVVRRSAELGKEES